MEGNGIINLQSLTAKPGKSLAWLLVLLFCLSPHAWGAGSGAEVRRLGLSKVADNTLLTVVLDRVVTPRVSSRVSVGQAATGGGVSRGPGRAVAQPPGGR